MTSTTIRLNERELETIKSALDRVWPTDALRSKIDSALFACNYQKKAKVHLSRAKELYMQSLDEADRASLREDFGSSNPVKGRPAYLIKNKKHEED